MRNRTFFFTNVEQRRLDQSGLTTVSEPNVNVINAQAGGGRATRGRSSRPGVYPNPVDTTHLLAKVDHQLSSRDQLSVRYSLYDVRLAATRAAPAG